MKKAALSLLASSVLVGAFAFAQGESTLGSDVGGGHRGGGWDDRHDRWDGRPDGRWDRGGGWDGRRDGRWDGHRDGRWDGRRDDRWGRGGWDGRRDDRWGRGGWDGGRRDGRIGDRDGRIGDRDGRIGDRDGRGGRDGRIGDRNGRRGMIFAVNTEMANGICYAQPNCTGESLEDMLTQEDCFGVADGASFAPSEGQCINKQ